MKIPLVLFAYNRPKHLRKSLDSIKKSNNNSKLKKIYFFCDGPKINANKKDIKKIEKCRKIITNVKWIEKEMYFQKKNIGIKNTLLLSGKIIFDKNKHNFSVFLEDDNVILPGFFDYMQICSKKFKLKKNIFSVTGYNFLLNKKLYQEIKEDIFFLNHTNTWSIGLWRRSWKIWKKEIFNLEQDFNKNLLLNILKKKNYILYDAILEGFIKKNNVGSTFAYTAWKYDKKTIFPKYPFIKNIGMDGSGQNCIVTNKYQNGKRFPRSHKLNISKKIVKSNENIHRYITLNSFLSKKKIIFYRIVPYVFQVPILTIYYKICQLSKNYIH